MRLFHAVLDDGLIHHRQHFFGLGFGGGQEARAQSSGGNTALRTFMVIEAVVRCQLSVKSRFLHGC
jgi:hypothetical protein